MQWKILIHVALASCFDTFALAFLQQEQIFRTAPSLLMNRCDPAPNMFVGAPEKSCLVLQGSENNDDELFDVRTTLSLVGGQSVLIVVAVAVAAALGTPNFGLGPKIDFGAPSLTQGFLMTLPLGILAYALDLIEDSVPALQDVTKATQRSVLAFLGGSFKPLIGLSTSVALGLAAGLGEEMLFRGVLQYETGLRTGDVVAVALTSIIFGALHAVTPLYALLASLASVYFGYLYLSSGNLAVPISTHAIYDIGALFYAHWTVAQLSEAEKVDLLEWQGPLDGGNE
jgi:membrane protease YdiL (CAAX protease family)